MKCSQVFSRFFLPAMIIAIGIILAAGCVSPSSIVSGTGTAPATSATTAPATLQTPGETVAPVTPDTTVATPVPTTTAEGTQFLKYTNTVYGFSMDYPSTWQAAEIGYDSDLSDPGVRVVEFYSPSILRCDTDSQCMNVRATVSVDVDTTPFTDELEDYYVRDVARITTAKGVDITRKQAKITLSGVKGYSFDFASTDNYGGINVMRAYTIVGDHAYIVTFLAHAPKNNEEDMFDKYYNDIQHMLKSFSATGGIKTI